MTIQLTIDAETLKKLVLDHIQQTLGEVPLKREDVEIMVKSKQNYKSEWERADFKVLYTTSA